MGWSMRDAIILVCLKPFGAYHRYFALDCGPLAQLAEQQTLNLRVEGSIPSRLTTLRAVTAYASGQLATGRQFVATVIHGCSESWSTRTSERRVSGPRLVSIIGGPDSTNPLSLILVAGC